MIQSTTAQTDLPHCCTNFILFICSWTKTEIQYQRPHQRAGNFNTQVKWPVSLFFVFMCMKSNCLFDCLLNFFLTCSSSCVQVSLKFECSDYLLRGAVKNPVLFWSAGQLTLTVDLCLLYTPETCAGIRAPFWKPQWTISGSYSGSSREPRSLSADRGSWSTQTAIWCFAYR